MDVDDSKAHYIKYTSSNVLQPLLDMHTEKQDSRSSVFFFFFPNKNILDKSLLINLTH